jgi:hypothetical protein
MAGLEPVNRRRKSLRETVTGTGSGTQVGPLGPLWGLEETTEENRRT